MDKSLKKQLKIPFWIFRSVLTLILFLYALIFFGLLLFAFVEIRVVHSFVDYIYAAVYVLLGVTMIMVMVDRLLRIYRKDAFEKLVTIWWSRRWLYLWATIFFVILYFTRYAIPNLLLYAGFMIGGFFIKLARNAYHFLFGLDLYRYGFAWVAWIFQWQFVYALMDLFSKFRRKK